MEDFKKLIFNDKSIIEERLSKIYSDNSEFEKMCAYSFSVGGKRIRAILLLEAFKIYRDISDIAIDFSVALELIHNYSLVHDDLPEMDDDKFRRGVLSVYGKYGQSNAVLVGDELLNNANLIMIKAMKMLENSDEINLAISASEIILNSSGINGMIYGQFLDLENNVENLKDIEKINSLKTGELFKAAILAGAKLGGASDNDLTHLEIYAKNLGLVFQLQDDLFDYDEDIKLKKKTFATVLGKSEVEKKIEELNKISLQEINKISENKNSVEKIFVVGGLGKRIDMTLSNLFIMEKYKNLVFLQENEEIFYTEKSFVLKNKKEYEFSIIPISEKVEKLTLKGFKFETDKIDVKRESSRLVSNVILENEASVEFENGKLIIILKNNNKIFNNRFI